MNDKIIINKIIRRRRKQEEYYERRTRTARSRRRLAIHGTSPTSRFQLSNAAVGPSNSFPALPVNAMGKFFVTYSVASILLTIGVVSYAWQTRIQFYPTVIFLCTSKFSVAVLCNLAICLTMITFKTVTSIFLGKLRDAEYEVLSENARYAFTETCLTYFRDELNLKVAGLFVALLVNKNIHWLCKEHIHGRYQNTFLEAHSLDFFKATFIVIDTAFVSVALHSIQTHGPSVWLLFGFEFLCLLVNIYAILRYILHWPT